ncbi:MAG: 30S ribosome-binding factor RbfA [Deferribacteres bacterium]|nr:30S ribosome-binding factor RbfA [candidate division KSB1 bacterium]MCB9501339.1 30S ribosome-binding factor RbfA [Deferribacteres bacterium]
MKKRSERVSQLLRQIISETIMYKWKHPNAHKITVQKVKVADNIRSAKIYVGIMGDEKLKTDTLSSLNDTIGFFKNEISHQTKLQFMPEIKFVYDDTLDQVERINDLLKTIK